MIQGLFLFDVADKSNPKTKERSDLQYPVDIIYRDDTTNTINNDEEMRIAKENCRD